MSVENDGDEGTDVDEQAVRMAEASVEERRERMVLC